MIKTFDGMLWIDWSGGRAEGRRALANTERDDVTYPETGYNSGRLLVWIIEESCMGVA